MKQKKIGQAHKDVKFTEERKQNISKALKGRVITEEWRKNVSLSHDDEAYKIDNIPIHAFDLIIADECHRGYTSGEQSKWREVLNYFDAVKIGLTATPARHTWLFSKVSSIITPFPRPCFLKRGSKFNS